MRLRFAHIVIVIGMLMQEEVCFGNFVLLNESRYL